MNQSALKTFAQDARNKLRQLIGARLDYVPTADTAELRQQAAQVNELRTALKTEGRDPLIERVAYTWFNRLTALRFMDANGYHPFGARVITPATANETLPELLQQARSGALDADLRASIANLKTFDDLLAGRIPINHPEAQVFKLLLVAACNYYHRLMPFLFEKIGDATELLLPEDLLSEYSIVADFRENLTDEDCRNEEVLGWFYQYYISEKKAEVDARKTTVPKEDIPAKTQLFTPHWIVRYIVENSLGRLWLLNRPHSKLRDKMPYYVEGEPETDFLKIIKPEDIRLLDPAGGSGHMLTYAFDLLYVIYEEEGYDAPEIPGLIMRHNLYGLDICDRAVALAAFALCMKARAKDNRFFRRVVQPHILSLQEIRFEEGELSAYFKALDTQPSTINPQLLQLLQQFEEAKNFGSLIQPCLSESEIVLVREKLSTLYSRLSSPDLSVALTHSKVLRVFEQAEYLSQRYYVVLANPPYMGNRDMDDRLGVFAREKFADAKLDLCTMFMSRAPSLLIEFGFLAMINMQSWMFLSKFDEMRRRFIREHQFVSVFHLGAHAFDSIQGEVVQTVAFVLKHTIPGCRRVWFYKLTEGKSEAEKESTALMSIKDQDATILFKVDPSEFFKLPGAQFAYAVTAAQRHCFSNPSVEQLTEAEGQNKTADNDTYLRLFWEVGSAHIGTKSKWLFYAKGGPFRKWHGNFLHIVDWSDTARAYYRKDPRCRIVGPAYLNRVGITWTDISSPGTSFRFLPTDATFDMAGPTIFPRVESDLPFLLGLLNSKPVAEFLPFLNPTLHVQLNDVRSLPQPRSIDKEAATALSESCRVLARTDWNNFENSWDFRDLPLLRAGLKGATLAASWQNWKNECDANIRQMQELETENNRLFITAYGLQDEMASEVPENQITLARADARKDMASFCSYAVGCMFGRYSLDQPGLILADAGATEQDYVARIPQPTFPPDADGILPVLDGEWFQDDIVGRCREFLRVTYGDGTLPENLAFIEASLGKELRKYFVHEFYKNHLKTYKKRPIYWMFSSPDGSFQALVYLHRYTHDTINLMLNDYLRDFIHKLEEKKRQLTTIQMNEAARSSERTKAMKELSKIDKTLKELYAWERDVLLPLAQQRINLDLDEGVKVNYLKFKGAVVNIPGLDKGEEE